MVRIMDLLCCMQSFGHSFAIYIPKKKRYVTIINVISPSRQIQTKCAMMIIKKNNQNDYKTESWFEYVEDEFTVKLMQK